MMMMMMMMMMGHKSPVRVCVPRGTRTTNRDPVIEIRIEIISGVCVCVFHLFICARECAIRTPYTPITHAVDTIKKNRHTHKHRIASGVLVPYCGYGLSIPEPTWFP